MKLDLALYHAENSNPSVGLEIVLINSLVRTDLLW
jgi:hypothetical protein